MKKLILLAILFCSIVWAGVEVKNPNQPAKGEWDFSLVKDWEVDTLDKEVLSEVSQATEDENGQIYLVESKLNKVFILSSAGKLLNSFGKTGEGPGEFRFARNLFYSKEMIIIPEPSRIHYFDKKGEHIKSINLPGIQFPRLFLDEDRFLTVSDSALAEKKLSEGEIKIYSISKKTNQTLVKLKTPEESMQVSSANTRIVLKIPGTAVDYVITESKPFLYYGVNNCYEIIKMDLQGNQLMKISLPGRKRGKNTEADKRSLFDHMKLQGSKIPKEIADQMIRQIPDEAFFFDRLVVDKNGCLYVFIPKLGMKNAYQLDIFSPEGKYIYRATLKLSDGYTFDRVFYMKNGTLLTFVEDDAGENHLVKYHYQLPN
jgi:hypothetical protein